jgi:hypothetical protein
MELADHGVDPGPDGGGPKVGNRDRLVLGVGLEAGAFAEVVLDLSRFAVPTKVRSSSRSAIVAPIG